MIRKAYTFLSYLALPLVVTKLYWRSRNLPAYRLRIDERFGRIPSPPFNNANNNQPVIWIHTVSVGEFIAAKPLIERILNEWSSKVVVTTMTPTGSEQVTKSFGDRVFHVYAPYDLPAFIRRFLHSVKPKILVLLETELWPNTLRECSRKNIKIVLINARLSEKSAAGYAKVKKLSREMLASLNAVAVQHEADAERFFALGLPREKAEITGSIKFDIHVTEELKEKANTLKKRFGQSRRFIILVAASTHKGEDEQVLQTLEGLKERAVATRLILVPRHPERFDSVYELCKKRGFSIARWSEQDSHIDYSDILLGDTMGELMLFLGASDCAFVGGSWVENGGHNYIEPAAWSLPVFSGPSQFNFADIAKRLQIGGGFITVRDSVELTQEIERCYLAEAFIRMGSANKAIADENRGALDACYSLLKKIVAE